VRIALCNEVIAPMSFPAQCEYAAKLGYDGLEIAPYTLSEEPHRMGVARIAAARAAAEDAGIAVTGLHWLLVKPTGLSISTKDEATRQRTVDVMRPGGFDQREAPGFHGCHPPYLPLGSRADVLVYSSPVLERPVEVIGPVTATLYLRASSPYHDVFVRLCDVEPNGRSVNICDGLVRLRPGSHPEQPDGTIAITIDLWPAAHRFRPGHRLRLQVSGGAHPRYVRNPGTPDPVATAVDLKAVDVQVWHDPDHPSAVRLPVL